MDTALHARNWDCSDFPDDELPGMTNSGGLRKVRNLCVRDFRGTVKFIGECAKSGAKNQRDLGPQGRLRKNKVSRFARAFELSVRRATG
jgi:hypothetical protein